MSAEAVPEHLKRRVQQRARRIQKDQNVKYTVAYRAAQTAISLEEKLKGHSAEKTRPIMTTLI